MIPAPVREDCGRRHDDQFQQDRGSGRPIRVNDDMEGQNAQAAWRSMASNVWESTAHNKQLTSHTTDRWGESGKDARCDWGL